MNTETGMEIALKVPEERLVLPGDRIDHYDRQYSGEIMKQILNEKEEILNHEISGFHRYLLTEPIHICFAGQNLCEMLKTDETKLTIKDRDGYADFIHPQDLEKYRNFITKLSKKEQTLTLEYRLLCADESVLYVRDTCVSRKDEEGTLYASSVLTDISDLKNESCNLSFLDEYNLCGFMKYTCEKQPKITYINDKMVEFLRFPSVSEGESDYVEFCKSNIFLMIPMEERRKFSKYLNRVYSAGTPIAGEMTLLRYDGTRAHVFGWVTKCINEDGDPEFQSVCMDVTERYESRKENETKRYLKALTEVYDKIFEFNLDSHTVKCLFCKENSSYRPYLDIAMKIDDAMDKLFLSGIKEEDYNKVSTFFSNFTQKKLVRLNDEPPQLLFRANSSDGTEKQYTGVIIKLDEAASLFCCRQMSNPFEPTSLANENDQLKEGMRDLVSHFFDGIAAFELSKEGLVKPLYASENVCEFFGYSTEEWMKLTKNYTPIENFVAQSEAAYEDFTRILEKGEAEFTYFDYKTETERRIKAVCSQREPNALSPSYVMLYDMEGEEKKNRSIPSNQTVTIRTFGYFDVFVGDKPIAFRNKKSKELFALLVDRKGGFVTSEEAISFLWEDEPANSVTLSRYRKVALRLKNTLEEYGISDVMETIDGKRRIVMEKVECDLYQFLSGREEYAQLFKGSYLSNYSWGENTRAELSNDLDYI